MNTQNTVTIIENNKEENIMSNNNEKNAVNNAFKLGGFDQEAADKKTKAEQQRKEELLANGGRVVDKCESIKIESYRLRFVPAESLWGTIFKDELATAYAADRNARKASAAYAKEKTQANKNWLEEAKHKLWAAFYALEQKVKFEALRSGAYKVDVDATVVRNNRRSLASDIAGVLYQAPDEKPMVDEKIVMIHHDTYELIPRNNLLAESPKDAAQRSANLCKNMIYSLQRKGVDLVFRDGSRLHYDFWASSSSHQKKGIAYFGESKMMDATAEIRNFGVSFDQLNEAGGDNGSEYIKRQAILFTPSAPVFNPETGEPLRLRDILMFKDIEVKRKSDNVANVTNDAKVTINEETLTLTQADGLALSKCGWLRSCQLRGYAIKAFSCKADRAMDFIVPDPTRSDLDGDIIDLNKSIYMTESCWKGNKLGYSWKEFVKKTEEMAEKYNLPVLDMLRVVRYADSAADKIRHLSRQSIQQWIIASENDVNKLASGALKELRIRKKLSGALLYEAELNRPAEERSDYAKAIEARPSILCSDKFQKNLENTWHNKLAERACGRIKIPGMYPYIAMDPVAVLQVLLEGRDPEDPDLGVLQDGQVNLPNTEDGEEVYGIRYPNNFLCGMVMRQKNHPAFEDVGEVAILPYHGFAIVRADGDFDGDEMLFTRNKLVISLMKRTISAVNPPLVSFPHEKAKRHPVDEKKTAQEIAIALYNGQAYNKVGQYSNIAMKMFATVAMNNDQSDFLNETGRSIILAHVATILVIDMVKTGTMPEAIKSFVEAAGQRLETPYSQIFMDHFECPYYKVIDEETKPGDGVADQLAYAIYNGAGKYEFDMEGVEFDGKSLLCKLPEGVTRTQVCSGHISEEMMEVIQSYKADTETQPIIQKAKAGELIKSKDLMFFFWRNESSLRFRGNFFDSGSDSDNMDEYYRTVREVMLNHGDGEKWLQLSEDARHRIVYNNYIADAFELFRSNGIEIKDDEEGTMEMKAKYARFIVRVFAQDIVNYSNEE